MAYENDVSIVSFLQKLDETDNDYSKSFVFWLIITVIIYSTLIASHLAEI